MSVDLERQLVAYGEHLEHLAIAASADPGSLVPAAGRRMYRRGITVAAAAAAIALVVIGSIALLDPFPGEKPPSITDLPTQSTAPATTIPVAPAPDLPASGFINEIEDLALAPDGGLWAATRGGVVRWDPGASIPVVYGEADGLPAAEIDRIVVAADGTVWAAGFGWVAYYDQTWRSVEAPDIEGGTNLATDPTGGVWLEGWDLLLHIDHNGMERAGLSVGWNYSISDLAVDAAGRVWVVGIPSGNGVAVYDGDTWREYTFDDGLPSHNLVSIEIAPDGTVWIGTVDFEGVPAAGVASFDGQSWTTYTTADGLASDGGAVVAAADGTVWVVHGDAVSRRDGDTWTVHDVASSVLGAVGGSDGTLWLGTDNGIVRFDGVATTRYVVPEEMTPATGSFALEPIAPAAPPVDAGSFGEVAWQTFEPPAGHSIGDPIATPHGFAASGETSMRASSDGVNWTAVKTPFEAHRFAASGDDLYALGAGAVRLAWTGTAWQTVDELTIPNPGPEILSEPGWLLFAERMAFGDGITVMTARSRVFFSTDGHTFTPAVQGPDPELLPGVGDPDPEQLAGACNPGWFGGWDGEGSIGSVFATENGFVAFTAGHPANWNDFPMCQPVTWTSTDGSTWDLASTDSPFGPTAYVRDMAERDGLIVAAGGRGEDVPVLWTSNNGLTWNEIPLERITGPTADFLAIGSGEAGWVALIDNGPMAARGMYSLDGLDWAVVADELPGFEWFGAPIVAVGTNRIMLGGLGVITIGEITR